MSTVETPLIRRFNVDEYHRMAAAGVFGPDERVELIEGEIVAMSPIGTWHTAVVARLSVLIYQRLLDGIVLDTQGSIRLDRKSEPQPDLALLHPRADYYADAHPGPSDVYLLISANCVESHRLPVQGTHREVNPVKRGSTIRPLAFPDVAFEVNDILGPAEGSS